MSVITQRLAGLRQVVSTIDSIVRKEVIKQQKLISQMNREQLLAGKMATGEDMPEYVPTSSKSGLIRLFDTGDFHGGIEPLFEDEGITLVGLDEKTGILIDKYGAIMGLTPSNIEKLRDAVRPKIMIAIRRMLGIK